ncbi:MAG: hypothetical protein K8S55_04125 [Phycisphaerae bacterium]|nr:hypothetical protein [Phycisphaerae bacterium]
MTAAIITFFAMVAGGIYSGQTPFACAIRCVVGTVAAYIAATLALKLAVSVMIKSVVENAPADDDEAMEEPAVEQE